MRLLLDEQLPHSLRQEIPGHQVVTIAFLGWSGVKNGELLQKAAAANIDALVTNDHGIKFEQKLNILPLSVIYLNSERNTVESLRLRIPALLQALSALRPCEFVKLA
jgi:hypothetical protein